MAAMLPEGRRPGAHLGLDVTDPDAIDRAPSATSTWGARRVTAPLRRRRMALGGRGELLAFAAIIGLAALLRLPGLAERGTWDADQGRHLLDLRSFVIDGQIPLLGPATSIGNFHHGVLYYFVLAPIALLTHVDPVAIEAFIAWGGVAAVMAVGWLARAIGGPVAGLIAALLAAVSSTAVSQSIFIWNPNLILLSSALALAAAWQAWQSGSARWWVGAGAAAIATMQFHVLGIVLLPVVGGLMAADAVRRQRAGDHVRLRRLGVAFIAIVLIGIASYVPLLIHEVNSGASELRGALTYLGGGGEPTGLPLPVRLVVVGLRVLSWPLSGLITQSPGATILSTALVSGLGSWLALGRRRRPLDGPDSGSTTLPAVKCPSDARTAVRWLGLGLIWIIVGLALGSASLATVTPGLANDDYHAFADPMIFVIVAGGLSFLAIEGDRLGAVRRLGTIMAGAVIVALVGWNLASHPPPRAPDGGWAAAQAAADRVVSASGGRPIALSSLPTFKGDEALRFPLESSGAAPIGPTASTAAPALPSAARVILCDQLYRAAIGADCGGPAEDAWLANPASGLGGGPPGSTGPALVDRFEAAPGRWISIYRP